MSKENKIMSRGNKIAVTNSRLSDEQLAKIKAAAPNFEISNTVDADCEIIFGHVSKDDLARAKGLKWLHLQSAGVEHVLRPEMGLGESVILTNSAGMHGIAIAEHMLGFTLMLMRKMHDYGKLQAAHKWEYQGSGKSIWQSVVTVVGLGGIGSQYAARCRALGATVRGVVRTARAETPDCVDELFTNEQLDAAITGADVVALSLPSTAETSHIINKERMLKMKKGAIIINIGRGSAIDQDALVEMLESGQIGGAGLDVTTPEPLPADSKLWDAPNVIITPHASHGGLDMTLDFIVDRFVGYLKDYAAGLAFDKVVDRKLGY